MRNNENQNRRFQTSKTINVYKNSILKLQAHCISYIGSVRVQSVENYESEDTNIVEMPSITYECCENIVNREKLEKLKPLKITKLNLDELNVAEHKLNEYSEQLDEIINRPFIERKSH